MRIEWDDRKNAANRNKHKLSFELAQYVFLDQAQITEDGGTENGEQRWNTIGRLPGVAGVTGVVVLVTNTHLDEDGQEYIRIISARKATANEVKRYEIQEPVITRRV